VQDLQVALDPTQGSDGVDVVHLLVLVGHRSSSDLLSSVAQLANESISLDAQIGLRVLLGETPDFSSTRNWWL